MDAFRWIAVVLSTVLGLGIARILTGYATAFKLRHRTTADWLPLLLSAVILGEMLQFWWAIAELGGRTGWTLPDFTLLLALVVQLFLAAALVAPTEADLAEGDSAFARDGRWAFAIIAAFHLTAIVANAWFWEEPLLSLASAGVVALAAISTIGALVNRRRVQIAVLACYAPLTIADVLLQSPASY
ncbi:hypothetical protein [Methylobrevis albus]|uniref:Uncharacterized protein n=1 Tax=Methylobrevis albus TaxID=2793297 RepID=A0A931MXW8_9HYPH|nr:hypothetical protein [Methylobrevis albus]MBH0236454.1 hypothetical protein [Methylobrevis albus]